MTKFLMPLLIIGVAGVVFFQFTDPLRAEIDQLEAHKDKLNKGLENAKELREVKDKLLAERRSLSGTDLDRLNKLLPDSVDNVKLIIDIDAIAKRYGMNIKDIEINTAEGKSSEAELLKNESLKKGALTLGFSVSAPYLQFQSFMTDLARSLRLVDVASISFAANEKNLYEYQVEIQTYWLNK